MTTLANWRLDTSKTFENKIERLIKTALEDVDYTPELIHISDVGIELGSGYGQYREYVDIEIDDIEVSLKKRTTSSSHYDLLNHCEDWGRSQSNFVKRMTIRLIEENLDKIEEQVSSELLIEA